MAEEAARAAALQAAVEALGRISGAEAKAVNKPDKFSGKNWSTFKFKFENYMSCIDEAYEKELQQAENHPNKLLSIPSSAPGTQRRSGVLFSILAGFLEDGPLQQLKVLKDRNGYQAWLELCNKYEPRSKGRALQLLQDLMEHKLPQAKEKWWEGMLEWE